MPSSWQVLRHSGFGVTNEGINLRLNDHRTPQGAAAAQQIISFEGVAGKQHEGEEIHLRIFRTDDRSAQFLLGDGLQWVEKTLEIHFITELNDDEQTIAVGDSGAAADSVCVTTHGEMESIINSDPAGGGAGDDGFDAAGNVTVGPNLVCETDAIEEEVAPTNEIEAEDLETYLNEQIWQPQANIHFEVTRSDAEVHFDVVTLDRVLGDYSGDGGPPPVPAEPAELQEVDDEATNPAVDYNGYIALDVTVPVALTVRDLSSFMSQDHNLSGTPQELIYAQELGHLLDDDDTLGHMNQSTEYLMHTSIVTHAGQRIQREYWRDVNKP